MKKILFILICFMSIFMAEAQLHLPYIDSFENQADNADWILNYNPNISSWKNKWYIGTGRASDGKNGLYISSDNGVTPSYVNSENTLLAYKVFDLPAGTYDLAFDWIAYGEGTSALYVAWIDSATNRVMSLTSPDVPAVIDQNKLTFESGVTSLKKSSAWQRAITQITSDGTRKYKLVFAWNNTSAKPIIPGACIDNIQIANTTCGRATNLNVTSKGNAATISWTGNAASYDLKYKNYEDAIWSNMQVSSNTTTITGLKDGVYDFWLRSVCGTDTGIWISFPQILVYDALCIDYVNLDSANCTYGTFKNPELANGIVDYGYASIKSRHTIHFIPEEYDPRTNGVLKTVPDGEIASVRLGSWDNAHAETVTYDYLVNTDVARVLTLKYAIVFEDPNHAKVDQPRFLLQIFDGDGKEVDPDCAGADFYAKKNTDGWTTIENGSQVVVWKDWTTLGLNLEQFNGQKIKIKLTTMGCAFSAHYAYAYFTLGCSSGKLEGLNCGNTPTNEFIAPEGFNYRWYTEANPTKVLSTDGVFAVDPNDKTNYKVDIIYPEMERCYFTLSASAIPRFPKAKASYNIDIKDCKAVVRLKDESYIQTEDGVSDEEVETILWTFDNKESSLSDAPEVEFPNDGKPHEVKLIAGLCNNLCSDTLIIPINIPILKDTIVEIAEQICEGFDYEFASKKLSESGVYYDTLKTFSGCDSIFKLTLEVIPEILSEISDTICSDQVYDFNGEKLSDEGKYIDTLKSVKGCDSIITLNLKVLPALQAEVDDIIESCADDKLIPIAIDVKSGLVDDCKISFSQQALDAGFVNEKFTYENNIIQLEMPASIKPNYYDMKLTLLNSDCGQKDYDLKLKILYPSSIMEQKWNDAFAVLNSKFNGGYNFSAFQWYKNDMPIDGAINSYYYLTDNKFVKTDEYFVMLTRVDDQITLPTCKINPIKSSDVNVYVVLNSVKPSQVIKLPKSDMKSEVRIYTMVGLLVSQQFVDELDNEILAPALGGTYIVSVRNNEKSYSFKLFVK